MSIVIPVTAELNQQAITQQVDQMRDALNNLGRVAQDAGKIKFNPISEVTLGATKQMRAEFDAMVKMSPGLKRALEAGGQGGKKFDEIQWGQVWKDPNQRAAHAASMLRRLRPSSAELLDPPKAEPSGTAGSRRRRRRNTEAEGEGEDNRTPGTGGPKWKRAIAGGAAGIAGGVAGQIGGTAGGVASGALAGGLAGGPIGAVVGGLAGAITGLLGVVGEARDIAISLDTLKRTLGDTNISFDKLQDNTRSLADEFSLTDTEAVGLTKQYSQLSGADKDLPELRKEVGVGVGFSRSFGLDPSAGVGFFGQMRGMGITQSADDSKKLALLIGESVAKAGDLPRLGDVLAGLTRYMEGAARTSLTAPDSAAWLSRFAGLEQSGLAGMDPQTAASIIGNIDGSIRAGGITEAGKNFMNGVLQKDQGLNTIQSAIQLEGGAFGTGRSTFGADSPMAKFYSRFGGGAPLSSWTSDESNVSVLQRNLIKQYEGKSPELMLDAFKNTFGTSYGQSAAWMATDPQQNDSMLRRMQRLGINWKDVNATGVSQMSQIEADSSLDDGQKDQMIREAATKNQEDTIGSEARKASIDGANAMVRLAEQGLPMISSIQAGVLKLAGMDPLSGEKAKIQETHDKNLDAIYEKEGNAARSAQAEYERVTPLWKRASGINLTPEQEAAKKKRDDTDEAYAMAKRGEMLRWHEEKNRVGKPVTPQSAATNPNDPTAATKTALANPNAKKLTALQDQHAEAIKKIKAEQGSALDKARDEYEKLTPEELRTPTAQLSDDQQMAKDRYDAAKVDYDDAVSTESGRFEQESAKLKPPATPGTGGKLPSKPGAVTPELLARARQSDVLAGFEEGTTAALMMQESSFDPQAKSKAGALGLHQIMPKNVETYSKRVGRQLDPTNPDDSFYMYDQLMAERKRKYGGNTNKMLRSYHGGYDEDQWGEVNQDYIPAIERRKRQLAAASQDASPSSLTHKVEVDVTMRDGSGNRRDDATINTTVGKPVASGVAR